MVALERCDNYQIDAVVNATRSMLDRLGGISSFIQPGSRVLLKPNMLSGDKPERAVTTHPSIIEAMIVLCRELHAEPVVGDSPAMGTARKTSRGCGIAEVCKKYDVPVLDLGTSLSGKADPVDGVERPQISDRLAEFDVLVNLPKVKVHQQIYLSLAVKNLFGCIPGRRKALWHLRLRKSVDQFGRMLVANLTKIRPTISIADAVIAMERSGPRGGVPRHTGLLGASADPVALDRVLIELLGAKLEDYPVLKAARELGVGETTLENIDVRGLSIEEARIDDFVLIEKKEMMPIGFSLPHIIRGLWRQFRGQTLPPAGKPV